MGVNVKMCLSLATVIVVSLVLLNLSHCRATPSRSNIGNGSQCNNPLNESHGDMESEFMMDSETNRMLFSFQQTKGTSNPNNPVYDCGRGNSYKPCIDAKGKNKIGETCGPYKKTCHL